MFNLSNQNASIQEDVSFISCFSLALCLLLHPSRTIPEVGHDNLNIC